MGCHEATAGCDWRESGMSPSALHCLMGRQQHLHRGAAICCIPLGEWLSQLLHCDAAWGPCSTWQAQHAVTPTHGSLSSV